ncbi:MAG: NAD(P)-dependent oxidoreductase [Prevotellaceae bacterium]|nr:NAD(P)-dependent oxidoreductase [Prevotellaceae bacterium]
MKLLVTGASGFLGSHLCERALAEGHEVWAAVRASSPRGWLTDSRLHFITLDLARPERLEEQLAGHKWDAAVHAAGLTKARRRADFARVNTAGTLALAEALRRTGALGGRFVFVSSLSAAGAVRETMPHTDICESDRPAPQTAYGRSKLEAERGLARIDGLDYVVLRPTGVYGPRDRDYFLMAQSVARGVDFAAGRRPQDITFVYVKDLAAACLLAATQGKCGATYNLSDGATYSSRDYADLLQQALGKRRVLHIKAPLWLLRAVCTAGEAWAALSGRAVTLNMDKFHILAQRNWRCDISAARRELGYAPAYDLERGVRETVEWYKKEKWI